MVLWLIQKDNAQMKKETLNIRKSIIPKNTTIHVMQSVKFNLVSVTFKGTVGLIPALDMPQNIYNYFFICPNKITSTYAQSPLQYSSWASANTNYNLSNSSYAQIAKSQCQNSLILPLFLVLTILQMFCRPCLCLSPA